MNRKKRIFINSSTALLYEAIAIVCGFILPRLIMSSFGSQYNGIVSSITQFLSFISLFRSGIGGVTKVHLYKSLSDNDVNSTSIIMKSTDKYMKKVSMIFVIGLMTLSVFYPFIVIKEFDWLFTATLVVIIGFSSFCENYFGFSSQILLQADQKEYIISLSNIVSIILNTIIAYILIQHNATIHVVKIGSSLAFTTKPIFLYLFVNRRYGLDKSAKCNMDLLQQTKDAFTHTVAEFIHMNTDVVILSLFTNTTEISVYSVYCLIINGLRKLIRSITSNIEAVLGELKSREKSEGFIQYFHAFEFAVFFLSTIVFTCAALLSEPFVMVYTSGIADANYSRLTFAVLISIAELFYSLRLPYQYVIRIYGRFKETKVISVLESIINIAISLILISRYKLVGVAIGTLVAMIFRTLAYQFYTTRDILNESLNTAFMNMLMTVTSISITVLLFNFVKLLIVVNSYVSWIALAAVTMFISIIATFISAFLFRRNETYMCMRIVTHAKRGNK